MITEQMRELAARILQHAEEGEESKYLALDGMALAELVMAEVAK